MIQRSNSYGTALIISRSVVSEHRRRVQCTVDISDSVTEIGQTAQHVFCEFLWIRRSCDYKYLNDHYCVLFSSRIRVRIRFSVWLVSGYAHVCDYFDTATYRTTCNQQPVAVYFPSCSC